MELKLVFSAVIKLKPIFLIVVELNNSSMAFKALLSSMDLSIILGVKRSSLSILNLEISNIFNKIGITKFLKGN